MKNLKINNEVYPMHTSTGIEPQIIIRGEWLEMYGFPVGAELEMDIRHKEITLRFKD